MNIVGGVVRSLSSLVKAAGAGKPGVWQGVADDRSEWQVMCKMDSCRFQAVVLRLVRYQLKYGGGFGYYDCRHCIGWRKRRLAGWTSSRSAMCLMVDMHNM